MVCAGWALGSSRSRGWRWLGLIVAGAALVGCAPSHGPLLIQGNLPSTDNLPRLSGAGYSQTGSGQRVWGCYLVLKIPVNRVSDATYSFDYSVRYGTKWHTHQRVSLATVHASSGQSVTYVAPEVYTPAQTITAVRYRLFHGQMQFQGGTDDTALTCPAPSSQ